MDLERARNVIRALLAKTEERGCTEEEAAAAAKKAFELMEKYQIEMTDDEIEKEGADVLVMPLHNVGKVTINMEYKIKDRLAMSIAQYTHCKVWVQPRDKTLHVVGAKSDLVLFEELVNSFTLRAYYLSGYAVEGIRGDSRTQRGHYILGFCSGIYRLVQDEQKKAAAEFHKIASASGTSLVVVKDALVAEKWEEVAPENLRKGRTAVRKVGEHYYKGRTDGLQQKLNIAKKLQ